MAAKEANYPPLPLGLPSGPLSPVRDWQRGHAQCLFLLRFSVLSSRSRSAEISTYFRAFEMFSRTAFRLKGTSKAVRSFTVAAQVITLQIVVSFPESAVNTLAPSVISKLSCFVEPPERCCSRCCWRNWPAYVIANETAYSH